MTLRILRLDKKEETRASEIAKDWRKWATNNDYFKKSSIPVQQGDMSIKLEIWEDPLASKDAYLFYHPEVPTTTDTEVLYIINDKSMLERIVGISKHMAADLMRRIQLNAERTNGNSEAEGMNENFQ